MFKNLLLFRLKTIISANDLADMLGQEEFAPCGATQNKSTGWVPPRAANGPLVEIVDGQRIAKFAIETKSVPAHALRQRVDELALHIEVTTGRTPGRREKKDLREDALQELLPHAFPKRSEHYVWLDPETGILALDVGSMSRADEITASLTRTAPRGFELSFIQSQHTPQSAMAQWLDDPDEIPNVFNLGRACQLKGTGEQPATVNFKHHDLMTTEVAQHLADGKLPIALALDWDDRVRFTLTDAMALKSIAFDESVFTDGGDNDDRFDTDVAIKTAELKRLIAQLLDALGGEQVKGAFDVS